MLGEIIRAKLKSRYGKPLSKNALEHQVQAQVQEELEHERRRTQDKLDTIVYPILNYAAIPSLSVKTDAPRWTAAVELFVAEPRYTTSQNRFDVSTQFANFALRTDTSIVPGLATCPLCKRDVSPTAWHLITECTLKTRDLNMPVLSPLRAPLPATASDQLSSSDEDDATAASAQAARGTDAYLAQELEHILRHYRPEGKWHIELSQMSEQNVFFREFELTCATLTLSCQNRQHDDDRSAPRALNNEGEINKFNTLRFLACHLPHDPLASIFKIPKDEDGRVLEEAAEEIRMQRKAFFQVWLRVHQLVAQAITQVKYKYNRMSAANRAAAREEDAPQFRDANNYQMNQTTTERAEQAEAQQGARTERNERRSSTDLLELNRKNEMEKKGNHINPTVATSQIGYLMQKRIDEHTTYAAPFVPPSTLTQAERMSRWPRAAEKPEEPEEAMDTGSMRNPGERLQEGHDPYDADNDSRRASVGSSLTGSRVVTPLPNAWEAMEDQADGGMGGTSGLQQGSDHNSGIKSAGKGGDRGGSSEPHGNKGGKGSNSGQQGGERDKGSSSGLHGGNGGKGDSRGLGGIGSSKSGSNEPRNDGSGKGGSGGHTQGGGKGKDGSSGPHGGGDGSRGGGSGLSDKDSS